VSYSIFRTNGSLLTTIPDGTVNTTSTPLSLPGRNFASYGQIVDTNFVRALENFADTAPPSKAMKGQLWYNTNPADEGLYICPTDGETNPNNWVPILTPDNIGNITVANLTATGNITANNAAITNNANANAITANNLTVNVQANIASATITGALAVTGNITAGNFVGGLSGAATTAGTVTTNAQSNITSVGTLTGLAVSGNASFTGQLISLGSNGNVRLTGGSAGHVLSTDGTGVLSWISTAAAETAITITANAQPNITSTGTLTGLNVSGNASFTGANVNLGPAANLKINGGTSGQILTSLGSGNVTWQTTEPVIPSGTRMIFAQTNAPTGWVKDTTNDDAALRVVSGTAGSGGSVNFTAAFTSQSVSGTVGSTSAGGTVGTSSITAGIGSTAVSGTVGSATAEGSIGTNTVSAGIGETAVGGVIGSTAAGGTIGTNTISAGISGTSVTGSVGQTAVSGTTNSIGTGIGIFPNFTRVENEQLEISVVTSVGLSDPGHNHSFTTDNHDHTFSSPSHTHDFTQSAHGHTFAGAGHNHTFSSPNHSHAFTQTAHGHTFAGSPHSHLFSSPGHTHDFTQTAHSHTFAGNSHNHTFSGTAIDLAVKYVDTIIATKS
jgi:hypothetical protein